MARLRRNLSASLVSERAGISRATLCAVEKGYPSVAIGIYAAVLHTLNHIDQDLLLVAKDDVFGRQLQDMKLVVKKSDEKKGDDTMNEEKQIYVYKNRTADVPTRIG